MEAKTMSFKINEVSRKTLDTFNNCDIKLKYYWEHDGKMTALEKIGRPSDIMKKVNVVVEEVVRSLGTGYTWTEWQVKVNGKAVDALDCAGYKGNAKTKTIDFEMIVQQG